MPAKAETIHASPTNGRVDDDGRLKRLMSHMNLRGHAWKEVLNTWLLTKNSDLHNAVCGARTAVTGVRGTLDSFQGIRGSKDLARTEGVW